METLKNNIKNLSKESEDLIRDYINLFTIKQSEKLALLLGILSSVFMLCVLILLVILFTSIALATYLNELLLSGYLGYLIVSGVFILIILIFIFKIIRTQTPLLTNHFIKFIISIFNINISHSKNLKGLKHEIERVEHEIEKNEIRIKADVQIIRYVFLETLVKEFFDLLKSSSKQKGTKDSKTE